MIVAKILNLPKDDAILPFSSKQQYSLQELEEIKRTIQLRFKDHCPMSYITGEKEFWSLPFTVTRDTLIPRPDSETIVENALLLLNNQDYFPSGKPIRILDIGTGSGCLLISIIHSMKTSHPNRDIKGVGIDISNEALSVAALNAKRHELQSCITFKQSNYFDSLNNLEQYNIIVSNPPYIATEEIETLESTVSKWEPLLALSGDSTLTHSSNDGLNAYRTIANRVCEFLRRPGFLIMECGKGQAPSIVSLFEEKRDLQVISIKKDLSGIDRCLIMKRSI